MNNNLQLLIKHLKQEKLNLESEVNKCVEQKDFQSAQYFSDGLDLVNSKLHVLAELDHTNRLKIERQKESLEQYEERLKTVKYDAPQLRNKNSNQGFLENYLERQKNEILKKKREHIEKLESEPIKEYLDGEVIDELISNLAADEIKSFRLKLRSDESLFIDFEKSLGETLAIKFPDDKKIIDRYFKSKHVDGKLKALGFKSVNNRLQIEIQTISNSIKVKELLAIIFFEVYFYKHFDEEITIEIQE